MKRVLCITGLAALLVGIGLASGHFQKTEFSTCDPQAYKLYVQGQQHLSAYQNQQALQTFRAALQRDQNLAVATCGMAAAFMRTGRNDSARTMISRADSLCKDIADSPERQLVELYIALLCGPSHSEKRDSLIQCLEPSCADHRFVLEARLAAAQEADDRDLQEKICQTMLKIEPNDAATYNRLGYLELERGNYSEAIALMQKYVFVAPELANPHDSLGDVLTTIGRYEEAEAEYHQAIAMQPGFHEALINLGVVYISQGKLDKGIDLLENIRAEVAETDIAQKIDQRLIGTYYTHMMTGELESSLVRFFSRYPEHNQSGLYRAYRAALRQDFDSSYAIMDSCLSDWHSGLGYKRIPRIRDNIDQAEYRFRAMVAEWRGAHEEALTLWRRSLEMQQDAPPHNLNFTRERIAHSLIELNRAEEAIVFLQQNLSINPRQINALLLATRAQIRQRNLVDAQKYLYALEKSMRSADADMQARYQVEILRAKISSLAADS